MNYVGIYITKQTHFASIMNSDGEILVEPFSFSNDHVGFQKLSKHLSAFAKEDILPFIRLKCIQHNWMM